MTVWHEVTLDDLVIDSERIRLRPLRPGDEKVVVAAMQDRSLHRFLPLPDPYTEDEGRQFLEHVRLGRAEGSRMEAAIEERASGLMVGTAGLFLPSVRRTAAEVGYAMYRQGRGHGYAAEATRALADWAFEHELARVELVIDLVNVASIKTALSAGFRYEGVNRHRLDRPVGDAAIFGRTSVDDGSPVSRAFPALGQIGDGVLSLRPMSGKDVETVFAENDNPESRRWNLHPGPAHRANAELSAGRAELDWLVGANARMVMVDLASAQPAGTIALHRFGPPDVGLIGYGVLPAFRGRGYTARALRLLSAWAFDHGFARLELGVASENVASQRAARSGGFAEEALHRGRLRTPQGTYSDELMFALVNPNLALGGQP